MDNNENLNSQNNALSGAGPSSKKTVIILSAFILLLCLGLLYMVFSKPNNNRTASQSRKNPPVSYTYDSLPLFVIKIPIIKGSAPSDQATCSNETVYKSINAALSETKQVCILALDNQNLSSLPKDITKLKDLQFIFLRYNSLTSFPTELFTLPNLRGIDISNNSIKTLPKDFSKLLVLTKIVLSGNPINSTEQVNIRKTLGLREIIF